MKTQNYTLDNFSKGTVEIENLNLKNIVKIQKKIKVSQQRN